MNLIWRRMQEEPVAFMAVVQSLLNVLVAFWVPITPEQIAVLMILVNAVLVFLFRRMTSPATTTRRLEARNEALQHLVDDRFPNPGGD